MSGLYTIPITSHEAVTADSNSVDMDPTHWYVHPHALAPRVYRATMGAGGTRYGRQELTGT